MKRQRKKSECGININIKNLSSKICMYFLYKSEISITINVININKSYKKSHEINK